MNQTIEEGSFNFGLKLYKQLSKSNENLVMSPFSLTAALAMTLYGARQNTGTEISKTLFGATLSTNQYKSMSREFSRIIDKSIKTNNNVLNVANFMYNHFKYAISPDFNDTLKQDFFAKITELDFTKPSQAVQVINKDISDATNGKISELLSGLDPLTRLVLANAVYFKGLWESQFKSENTKIDKFYTTNGDVVQVNMMSQNKKFRFTYNDELKCRAVELPYSNSNIAMVLILPDEGNSLENLEAQLTVDNLKNMMNHMHQTKVDLKLPRFKIDSDLHLVPTLQSLGMNDSFNQNADFSGMTQHPNDLYVGDVIQKAVIEVNEEGTEAAAATGIVFATLALEIPEEFIANRPFMYLLISRYETGKSLILFMGAVKNPK